MLFILKIEEISSKEYMSEEQVDIFKQELLDRKLSIIHSQEVSKNELSVMDITASDPIDKAAIQLDIGTINTEISKRNRDLTIINNALEYIRIGDYGFCQNCGEEIGIPRLKANPMSLLDVNCQSACEIKLKQLTGRTLTIQ